MVIVGSVVRFVAKNRQEIRLSGQGSFGRIREESRTIFEHAKNSKRNSRACERNYKGVIFLPVHIHAEAPVSDLGFRCRDIDVFEACKAV